MKYNNVNRVNQIDGSGQDKYSSMKDFYNWTFDKQGKYFFFCQNESIDGIEQNQKQMRQIFDKVKQETPDAIIVSDMSSSIGSRDLTQYDLWEDVGVIYAGAQKNLGTSGVTFVIIRDDVMEYVKDNSNRQQVPVPLMMDWVKGKPQGDFFLNTPSMMSIYMSGLVCEHMLEMGGIDYYEELADRKS